MTKEKKAIRKAKKEYDNIVNSYKHTMKQSLDECKLVMSMILTNLNVINPSSLFTNSLLYLRRYNNLVVVAKFNVTDPPLNLRNRLLFVATTFKLYSLNLLTYKL